MIESFLILLQDSPILLKIRAQFQLPTHCHLVVFLFLFTYHPIFSLFLPLTLAYFIWICNTLNLLQLNRWIVSVWLFCSPMDGSPLGSSVHGFPRQEYWSELPFSSPGDLPNPGVEPMSLASPAFQVDSLALSHQNDWNQLNKQQYLRSPRQFFPALLMLSPVLLTLRIWSPCRNIASIVERLFHLRCSFQLQAEIHGQTLPRRNILVT